MPICTFSTYITNPRLSNGCLEKIHMRQGHHATSRGLAYDPALSGIRPLYSLMLTCRACGIEPYAWLRHVLTEMPARPKDADISDLLPFNFKPQTA